MSSDSVGQPKELSRGAGAAPGGDIPRVLNHFAGYAFGETFWSWNGKQRAERLQAFLSALQSAAPVQYLYQATPGAESIDFLVWTARAVEDDADTAQYFEAYVRAVAPQRHWLHPGRSLWGYTGRSDYSKADSSQRVDPFNGPRRRYLVVYPFVKTSEWYILGRDQRQEMMNEHIRLGKRYRAIRQLLLYSFGLQDQEFVVVYEMDDLPLFSELVHELRATRARPYTERDTPLQTAIYHPTEKLLRLWSDS